MEKYVDCHNCQNQYDCERTYLGGCTNGQEWVQREERKLTDEEMAKVVCGGGHIDYERCGDCFGEEDGFCGCIGLVERLYNADYRKIPENAVVLTNDEFWALSNKFSKKELDEIVEFHKNKTRKETAEKFAEKVHNLFNRDIKDSVVYTQEEKDILKDFIESIDEILEEMVEGK